MSSAQRNCNLIGKTTVMDAIDSFSDEAGDPDGGGLPAHDIKVLFPWMHGRVKEKHKAKATKFVVFFLPKCCS